jgi:rSAM/selenodomain-associated transferase 1
VAGEVKTRLAAGLGDEAAARVYAVLLRHTLEVARSVDAEAVLALAEQPGEGWLPDPPLRTELQTGVDLGARLHETFRLRFGEGCTRVIVIGSDCAELRPAHLEDAFESLETAEVVLGPALDGGYWLVAQRHPGHEIFSGIPWSTAAAMEATRRRLRKIGVIWSEIATLDDIDTVEDLESMLVSIDVDPMLVDRLRGSLRPRRGSSEVE